MTMANKDLHVSIKKIILVTSLLSCLLCNSIFAEEAGQKDQLPSDQEALKISPNNIANDNNSSGNKKPIVIIDEKEITEHAVVQAITNSIQNQADISNIERIKAEEEKLAANKERVKEDINHTSNPSPQKTVDEKCCTETSKKPLSSSKTPSKLASVNKSVRETSFADNEQVVVVLSNRDINRILVKGDKIQSVNGPTGLYVAKNDTAGSAYISVYGDITFTLFATTEKGHNFSLLVTPKTVAGRTVILKPTSVPLLANRSAEAESYQKALVDLISVMINNKGSSDYAYSQIKSAPKVDFHNIAGIQQIASYSGSYLFGIVSVVKNKAPNPITLKPSYFYKPGVRAVALSQQTIDKAGIGFLYQVMTRE